MTELTEEDISFLKQQLQNRRKQVREEIRAELIRSDEEHFIDLAGRVHDDGEASVADLLHDLNIANINRQIRELREVEHGLQRISMGSYGLCDDCGGEISIPRLKSHPTAQRCLICQDHREKTFAGQARPSL